LRKARKFPPLYAIVDVEACERLGWKPRDLARRYLAGGARLLQLRAKALPSGALFDLACALVEDANAADADIIVNDRADITVLAGATGVHVGQDDLSPTDVRQVTGSEFDVGLSTHTRDQVAKALRQPVTYLAIGPVFSTATKDTGYRAVGYDAVRDAAARGASVGLPVVAIGGISLETAPRVIEAGAAAVAVITDLLTGDPEARVREYLRALHV
jgi:thiamine-phosphate pyrophosphorylase